MQTRDHSHTFVKILLKSSKAFTISSKFQKIKNHNLNFQKSAIAELETLPVTMPNKSTKHSRLMNDFCMLRWLRPANIVKYWQTKQLPIYPTKNRPINSLKHRILHKLINLGSNKGKQWTLLQVCYQNLFTFCKSVHSSSIEALKCMALPLVRHKFWVINTENRHKSANAFTHLHILFGFNEGFCSFMCIIDLRKHGFRKVFEL